MTDAWEIIGRLLTDAAFEASVFGAAYSGPYPMTTTNRARIPNADYQSLRNAVSQKVKGPISLMALGELLVAMRIPNFRAKIDELSGVIAAIGVDTSRRDPHFYQVLGAATVDPNLRQ